MNKQPIFIMRIAAILFSSCLLIPPAPAQENQVQQVDQRDNTNRQLMEFLRNQVNNPDFVVGNSNLPGGNQFGTSTDLGGFQANNQGVQLGDQDIRNDFNASFYPDELTGKLVVVTSERNANLIRNLLPQIARPSPQVLIKVLFLEVTYNKGLDFGADASMTWTNETDADSLLAWLTGVATETRGVIYSYVSENVEVTLRAIADRGSLEVLSRPVVLASNGQTAIFTVGNRVPFIESSQITDSGMTINNITYEDIGIILEVTPYIAPNGIVEMDVRPEISTITGESIQISDVVTAPVFAERSAETHCVVPSGQTAMIGGLMQDQKIEMIRELPILGRIPLLGMLFRRTIKSTVKTELIILLTPTVVFNEQELLDATLDEYEKVDYLLEAQRKNDDLRRKPFEKQLELYDLDYLQNLLDERKKREEALQELPDYMQRYAEIQAERLREPEAQDAQRPLDDKQQVDFISTGSLQQVTDRQQIDRQQVDELQRVDDRQLTDRQQQEQLEQQQLDELKKELQAQLDKELSKKIVTVKK